MAALRTRPPYGQTALRTTRPTDNPPPYGQPRRPTVRRARWFASAPCPRRPTYDVAMLSVLLSVLLLQAAGSPAQISGVVRDSAGAVVVGATVLVRAASGVESRTLTGSDGRFSLAPASPGAAVMIVRLSGFAEWRR